VRDDLPYNVSEVVERTRAAQGLPPRLTDSVTLDRIVALLRSRHRLESDAA